MTNISTAAAEAARRIGTQITTAGRPDDGAAPLALYPATVISINATTGYARVDSLGRQVQAVPLVEVLVGDTVWVEQVGDKAVILGRQFTHPEGNRFGPINSATNASSEIAQSFAQPFPTACDGVVVTQVFAGTGTVHQHVLGLVTNGFTLHLRTPAGVDVGAGWTYVGYYWAWGH